jgi:signal transduction histidine kinase
MFSKKHKKSRGTLGFRLINWYCGLYVLSSLALFGTAYALLSSSMERRDQDATKVKLRELAIVYQRSGVPGIEATVQEELIQPGARNSFVIRVGQSTERTLFLHVPNRWSRLDLEQLKRDTNSNKPWIHVRVKDLDDDDDDDEIVEVASVHLADHNTLQVGASTDDRDDVLERFGHISIGIMGGLILIGFGGGSFLSIRALRPFRRLLETVRSIVATGDLTSRVSVAGSGDELDELGLLFNGLLDKIRILINGMQSSLDHVAHDLRTPLARLRGIAELALRGDEPESCLREALISCVDESDRISAMLNTLMDISEAETGTMRLALEKVDVLRLLGQVFELYSYIAEEKGISLRMSARERLYSLADRNRITQVIANLVDNAIKYTPAGGQVDIDASGSRSEVVIRVTDTGPGIPPEERSRIWDRLYRGDKSRSQRGIGLGLSLVKAITQAHHGRIELYSEPGHGSQFAVYLPVNGT